MALLLGEIVAMMHGSVWLILLAIPVSILIKVIAKTQYRVIAMIFFGALLGFLITSNEMDIRDQIWDKEESSVEVFGNVKKIKETKKGYSVYLEDVWSGEESFGEITVFFFKKPDVRIGNIIKVTGDFEQFEEARNPGSFDMRDYYMSLGIYGGVFGESYEVMDSNYDFIRQFLYEAKLEIKNTLINICDVDSSIFKGKAGTYAAIMLGDKTDLDDETKDLYSVSGIAHILAISGLHISFIGLFFFKLLRRKFGFGISGAFSTLAVIGFGIISGMGIATIRALVMFATMVLGKILGRADDKMTNISLAGIFLILWNPFVIMNSGFQMSFVAIIGILVIWPKISALLGIKNDSRVIKPIAFAINISVIMAPLIAYYYYSLPTFSFLINLIVVPLMSVVMVSGVVGVILGNLVGILGTIGITPGCLLLGLFNLLCNVLNYFPLSRIVVGKPPVIVIFIYYSIVLFVVFFGTYRKKKKTKQLEALEKKYKKSGKKINEIKLEKQKEKALVSSYRRVVIVALCFVTVLLYGKCIINTLGINNGNLETVFLDVGQGDGVYLKASDGTDIMIDGGSTTVKDVGKNRIASFLKSECHANIDYWFLTHGDEDHISGAREILQNKNSGIEIENIVLPYMKDMDEQFNEIIELAKERGIEVLRIKQNDSLKLGDTNIKCLHPSTSVNSDDTNDYSIVLSVDYGEFSELLTGDLTSIQEEHIKVPHKYTVLKVGHHGSKYSSSEEFLEKVKPKIGILSSGKGNRYGHPTPKVMERLRRVNCKYLRTDKYGAITVNSNGNNTAIETYLKDTS